LNSSIKGKINIAVIGAAGVILLLIMTVVFLRTSSIVSRNAEEKAVLVCKSDATCVSDYVDEKLGSLRAIAQCFESQSGMGDLKFDLYKNMCDRIIKGDKDLYAMWYVEDFRISDSSQVQKHIAGADIAANSNELLGLIEKGSDYLQARQNDELVIGEPQHISGIWMVNITMPYKVDGKVVGAVGVLLKTDFFVKLVADELSSKNLACKILSSEGIVLATPTVAKNGMKVDEGDKTDEVLASIRNNQMYAGNSYSGLFKEKCYKVFVPVTFSNVKSRWSYCTMIPKSTIAHETNMLALLILLLIAVGITLLAITTNAIACMFTKPIVRTSKELVLIAEGRLDETKHIEIHSEDELGIMVDGLNLLLSSQKHLASFANEVGQGNLNVAIEAKSDKDIIGKAMVEMKQNLIAAKETEELRIYEDKIQDWKFEGAARIHETIRRENTSVKHLCDSILREVIGYTESIQGGIFVINEDQAEDTYVELVSCIAYNRAKMMVKKLSIDEGLIGRCIFERAPIVLAEIPQDYLEISSGLGDRKPNYLVIMPLINNEQVVGVVEIAGFKAMEPHVVEYLEKAAENLASAISNVNINERTQKLLDQSKEYSEEMAAQEEELRQNMEEMQAAQEEMHRKTWEYEETIESLRAQLANKQ